jgi:hypothetical protein
MDWKCGSNSRGPALQVHEFLSLNPRPTPPKKKLRLNDVYQQTPQNSKKQIINLFCNPTEVSTLSFKCTNCNLHEEAIETNTGTCDLFLSRQQVNKNLPN